MVSQRNWGLGPRSRPAISDTLRERVLYAWAHVGGLSGAVLTTIPVLTFVIVNALHGRWPAIWSSLTGAVLVGVVQVLRGEKLTAAFAGLGGAMLSSVLTVLVGEAKGCYLWAIWVALVIAIVLLVSVLARRPLIGLVWATLNFQDDFWRTDRRARLYYDMVTLFWSALCFLRFGVQFWLYNGDRTTTLGFANILLGTPLTLLSVLVTIWAIRKVDQRRTLLEPHSPDHSRDGEHDTEGTVTTWMNESDMTTFLGTTVDTDGIVVTATNREAVGDPASARQVSPYGCAFRDRHVPNRVSGYWTRFARSGSPDRAGSPHWPSFDVTVRKPRTRGLMPVSDGVGAVNDGGAHRHAFWNGVG